MQKMHFIESIINVIFECLNLCMFTSLLILCRQISKHIETSVNKDLSLPTFFFPDYVSDDEQIQMCDLSTTTFGL